MNHQIQVYFKNMEKSEALEADIRKRADGLCRYYDRIIDCSVTVIAPHHHHHRGFRYAVNIRISVPGDSIIVSQQNEADPTHEDPYATVHAAFKSARRQLQDFARIQRGQVKRHGSDRKVDFDSDLDETGA